MLGSSTLDFIQLMKWATGLVRFVNNEPKEFITVGSVPSAALAVEGGGFC